MPESLGRSIRGERWRPSSGAAIVPKTGSWSVTSERAAYAGPGGRGVAQLEGPFDRIDLEMAIAMGDGCKRAGVILGGSPASAGCEVVLDRANRRLAVLLGDGSVRSQIPIHDMGDGPMRLRIIVEQDMVEAFLDDQYSLAARLPSVFADSPIRLFADGGPAEFDQIELFDLRFLEEIESRASDDDERPEKTRDH